MEFSFDGHPSAKSKNSLSVFYHEKRSWVILIVLLPHMPFEMFSVLCVLLLDVCLSRPYRLGCFIVAAICGAYLCTSLGFIDFSYLWFSSNNSWCCYWHVFQAFVSLVSVNFVTA